MFVCVEPCPINKLPCKHITSQEKSNQHNHNGLSLKSDKQTNHIIEDSKYTSQNKNGITSPKMEHLKK